ncbi:MAG: hypothetical protein RL404_519 [Pseudomonadota bacterium]|jgi:BirA family biotin operon repressor/biotin-[acetyl-CoA-carboxylase] ligase
MRRMTDFLNAERISGLLAGLPGGVPVAGRPPLAIEVLTETGSTNADLRERAARLTGPLLLAAERQTAGRGRAGRSWLADPGDSLCFSLAWPCAGPLQRLTGLSLAVGVALAECLRARRIGGQPGTPVMLKWPNDLLVDGAKLGGILIETAGATAHDGVWVVVGVGLNVRANATRDAAIDQPAAALCEAGSGFDGDALLAQLASSLVQALDSFDRDGLAPFGARWDALHAHAGQTVSIVEQGRTLHQGTALGIDPGGCLLLATGAGIVTVAAGDVSLRAAAGSRRPPASEGPHAPH